MVKLDLLTKVQLQNVSNSFLVEEEKDFKLRISEVLKIGKEPGSVQFFPIIKIDHYLEQHPLEQQKYDLGTILDFRPTMIITEPLGIQNTVLVDFIRPFVDECKGSVRFNSQVCYKSTIYASLSVDNNSSLSLPIFMYSLVQGNATPIACNINEFVPQWNGPNEERNIMKMLHLQDSYLFCCVFFTLRRSYLVLKLDLDSKDGKWEIILLREQLITELEPRVIRVDEDSILLRTAGLALNFGMGDPPGLVQRKQVIIKLALDNALGNNGEDLQGISQFPFDGDGRNKSSDDLFYDFSGKRLFVFEFIKAQGSRFPGSPGNLFVYDFEADQWTKLPALQEMKMFISMRLEDNQLYVTGLKNCYDVCEVMDMKTQTWRSLNILDSDHKPLHLAIYVRRMQSRGYPVNRFLLCKDEPHSESNCLGRCCGGEEESSNC